MTPFPASLDQVTKCVDCGTLSFILVLDSGLFQKIVFIPYKEKKIFEVDLFPSGVLQKRYHNTSHVVYIGLLLLN